MRASLSEGALQTVTGPGGRNLPAMVQGFVDAIRFVCASRMPPQSTHRNRA